MDTNQTPNSKVKDMRRSQFLAVVLAANALFLVSRPAFAHDDDDTAVVYYLLDEKAVLGFGHAALLVGDDDGWDYYSFGPHSAKQPLKDNLVHRHFDSFKDARDSKELLRYTKQMRWTTNDAHRTEAVRRRIMKEWDNSHYNLVDRNCFHMVADGVKAGSFDIDSTHVAPKSAFKANEARASEHGAWPLFER
jgi:hypothetical protein